MRRVYVVVEGVTEEKFIKQVMGPELALRNVFLVPILIGLSRSKKGRGGNVNEQRAVGDVSRLLKQDRAAYCSTFLDYYGIDKAFPGKKESLTARSVVEKAKIMEEAFRKKVQERFSSSFLERRFLPYIQMHEYEGLLFSDPDLMAQALGNAGLAGPFSDVLKNLESPEEIDDNYDTKPSKRIEDHFPSYQKTYHGILAARSIGLESMRARCKHFGQWCSALEEMGRELNDTSISD